VKFARTVSALVVFTLLASGCTNNASKEEEEPIVASSVEPVKLPNKTVLKVSSAGSFEFMTALYVADALGELEKENIFVEYVTLPSQDAIPSLALGQVDVSMIGISATLFNNVADGADVRLVFPGPSSPNGDGLWVSTEFIGKSNTVSRIRIAGSQGLAWMGVVPVGRYLESVDKDWEDVDFTKLPISDLATALELGSVDAAWLNSPAHLPFEDRQTATLVAQYDETEVATGIAFGPRLLRNNPEIGQAFVRAMIRTIQTYLGEGYKSNPTVSSALARALAISESQVTESNELKFPIEFDPAFHSEAQQLWINFGEILSYSQPLDPGDYIDPRFTMSIILD